MEKANGRGQIGIFDAAFLGVGAMVGAGKTNHATAFRCSDAAAVRVVLNTEKPPVRPLGAAVRY